MNTRAYNELNIKTGATEAEIKAAFRKLAKEHHPDSGLNGSGDVDKFRRAYKAYRELLNGIVKNTVPISPAGYGAPVSPTPFIFDAQRRFGLDIYMDLALVKPESPFFEIVLPFEAHEACPRCLGRGQTLGRLNPGGDIYRPRTCTKCQGHGSVTHKQHLSVKVTPEMAQRGKFRLRGLGGYQPSQAKRGDLIVTLRWVDRLPVRN
jgi:molecular chaperone DnaJ